MPKFSLPRSPKLDFFYFLIVTILILIVFAVIILGSYFNYWQSIWRMESYYKTQAQ